jgi:hypothetical protein
VGQVYVECQVVEQFFYLVLTQPYSNSGPDVVTQSLFITYLGQSGQSANHPLLHIQKRTGPDRTPKIFRQIPASILIHRITGFFQAAGDVVSHNQLPLGHTSIVEFL